MRVSEGWVEVEFGGMEFDWNAVARLQPCCVNRFSTDACGRAVSENLRNSITDRIFIAISLQYSKISHLKNNFL